jgi:hypothetical protein
MHDPMTAAFEIKYPWVKSRRTMKDGSEHVYRESFATIWHVDPEKDGTDDSCGYTVPKLTKRQLERLRNVAWGEARNPYFLRFNRKEAPQHSRAELEALYRGLILLVADTLDIPCTFEQAAREAAATIHHADCIDRANVFCYLNGYHNNFPDTEDGSDSDKRMREDHFTGVMAGIARWMLRDRRPWYRHPRWHIHHWKIQIRPLQKLRRWVFDRCGQCGKRFDWNEAPITYSWYGKGPCFHEGCTQTYEATSKIIRESQVVS